MSLSSIPFISAPFVLNYPNRAKLSTLFMISMCNVHLISDLWSCGFQLFSTFCSVMGSRLECLHLCMESVNKHVFFLLCWYVLILILYRNITMLRWKRIGRILITIAGMRVIYPLPCVSTIFKPLSWIKIYTPSHFLSVNRTGIAL